MKNREPDQEIIDKSAIINTIVSNFYRTINTRNGDNQQLLLLIAALSVLNSETNSAQAISAARRLAQLAMSKGGRRK